MPDLKLKPPPQFASAEEAAEILGFSKRRLLQLVEQFPRLKAGHDRYNLRELKKLVNKRTKDKIEKAEEQEREPAAGSDPESPTERDARIRNLVAQAEHRELVVRQKRGELISIETSRREITGILGMVREHVLAIPRIAVQLVGLDAEQIQARLNESVRDVLTRLSNGQPLLTTRNPGEPDSLPSGNGDGAPLDGAAADLHGERVGGPSPDPA